MTCPREKEISDLCALELDSVSSDEEIKDEFFDISQVLLAPSTIGRLPQNIRKNRYSDVIPADFSLVQLKPKSYLDTTYCNGSWIKGVNSDRDYIAINGPLKHTLVDFYDMIYDNGVKCIVQLTGFVESGIEKCYNYLPKSGTNLSLSNGMIVSVVSVESISYAITTLLKIEYNNDTRLVKHRHFTEWIDQKVPQNPVNFINFQQSILNDTDFDTIPKVVHCSAGVGRTGSFITIDYAIREYLKDGTMVNICDFVKNLRLSRPLMVQTLDQYRFVYKVISRFMEVHGRWILLVQRKYPSARGDLTHLLFSIATACKTIAMAVRRAGIVKIFGLSGSTNTTGDTQKKLDVIANELFINNITSSRTACVLISEENEHSIEIPCTGTESSRYIVAFDPLDGSSNIDCLAPIGSIFAIWRKPEPGAQPIDGLNALQCGKEVVAAGYVLYGSATVMVLAINNHVNIFTLEPGVGEFILTHKNVQIPNMGYIYSINEGASSSFDPHLIDYLNDLKNPTDPKESYKGRYVGSMVSDIHRTLMYGGIYIYPSSKILPNGKLRLLYECIPMAYIVVSAGGLAVTPSQNILDIQPTHIHQTSPIYMGSTDEVNKVLKHYHIEQPKTFA